MLAFSFMRTLDLDIKGDAHKARDRRKAASEYVCGLKPVECSLVTETHQESSGGSASLFDSERQIFKLDSSTLQASDRIEDKDVFADV